MPAGKGEKKRKSFSHFFPSMGLDLVYALKEFSDSNPIYAELLAISSHWENTVWSDK